MLVDQSLGLTAVLNPVVEPVAGIVSQITATLGVTDELPARLQALTDVDDAGQAHLGSDLVVGVSGLVHSVPDTLDAAVAIVLTDTVGVPVPQVVGSTTDTVDTLLVDPTTGDLGAELESTLSSVDPLLNETLAGLNLGLDGPG